MTIPSGPWVIPGLLMLVVLFALLFGGMMRILLRSGICLLFLLLLSRIPALSCLALGVNPFNALVLGVFGAPGFALLLLLRWTLQLSP